jgi:hypothetical protein
MSRSAETLWDFDHCEMLPVSKSPFQSVEAEATAGISKKGKSLR